MTSPTFCCGMLRSNATMRCDHHRDPQDCPDVLIVWSGQHEEFGIPVRDGGSSWVRIEHCPWCGHRFPSDTAPAGEPTCEGCGCELDGAGGCWWCDTAESVPSVDEWWRHRARLYEQSRDYGASKEAADDWAERECIEVYGPLPEGPMRPFRPWLALVPASYDLSWHDPAEVRMYVTEGLGALLVGPEREQIAEAATNQ